MIKIIYDRIGGTISNHHNGIKKESVQISSNLKWTKSVYSDYLPPVYIVLQTSVQSSQNKRILTNFEVHVKHLKALVS